MKKCSICGKLKPLNDFCKHKRSKDGLNWSCSECNRARVLKWQKENPHLVNDRNRKLRQRLDIKIRNRINGAKWREKPETKDYKINRHWMRMYGLNKEQVAEMFFAQYGKCEICNIPICSINVDHDHKTGKVRGILCDTCNLMLGKIRDNITSLERAINYLKKHNGIAV